MGYRRTYRKTYRPRTPRPESMAELDPKRPFHFIMDPGHGFLKVARRFLSDLGIAAQITSFSFTTPHTGHFVYLEEDCDAACFADAFKARYGHDPITRVLTINEPSGVRGFPRYMEGRRFHELSGTDLPTETLDADARAMMGV